MRRFARDTRRREAEERTGLVRPDVEYDLHAPVTDHLQAKRIHLTRRRLVPAAGACSSRSADHATEADDR